MKKWSSYLIMGIICFGVVCLFKLIVTQIFPQNNDFNLISGIIPTILIMALEIISDFRKSKSKSQQKNNK